MGTLPEIIEEIVRADNSGVFTDENKEDNDYMESVIHEYRAQAMFIVYQKTKRINSAWTQRCVLDYEEDLQESNEYVLFKSPSPISFGSMNDGHLYVGSECGTRNFRKAVSRADLANRKLHRHTRTRTDIEKVLFSDLCYEVYGNTELRTLLVDGVHTIPTDVPSYNKYIDKYPISPDVLTIMKSYVVLETAAPVNQPADTVSDSQATTTSINAQ
jgi:hypothetical protein